jgi:hypothetical protein
MDRKVMNKKKKVSKRKDIFDDYGGAVRNKRKVNYEELEETKEYSETHYFK